VIFHQQNLRDLSLPEPLDFALCLNALMPESHSDALQILQRLFDSLACGGRLVLVLPSMEALLYTANMQHFEASRQGKEEQSLINQMETWSQWFSNPLGYVRNNSETVVKFWLKDEAEAIFKTIGTVRIVETFRLDRDQKTLSEVLPDGVPKSWFWGWVLERSDHQEA